MVNTLMQVFEKSNRRSNMYLNLRTTIRRNKMTLKVFAQKIGISERSVQLKLNGQRDWTYGEYKSICSIFPNENPVWLMENE